MKLSMKGGRVIIDGREFTGSSISITNGKVTVDGVTQDGELVGDVSAKSAGNIKTVSGDIRH